MTENKKKEFIKWLENEICEHMKHIRNGEPEKDRNGYRKTLATIEAYLKILNHFRLNIYSE